jgi:hypothetical protein
MQGEKFSKTIAEIKKKLGILSIFSEKSHNIFIGVSRGNLRRFFIDES